MNTKEKWYIYRLFFKNGCTYVGKHHQIRENDGYITSSFYYKKHKDLLERREIILDNLPDADTADIMETICIFSDVCENPYNVNYNKGAWMDSSKFDRGFEGPANGMYGRVHSSETKLKMSKAWTEERKKKTSEKMKGQKRPQTAIMNRSTEHIEAVREGNIRYMRQFCFRSKHDNNIFVSYDTWVELGRKSDQFKRELYNSQTLLSAEEYKSWHKEYLYNVLHSSKGPTVEGRHWYNNGIEEVLLANPPEDKQWVKGRLRYSRDTICNMKAAAQRNLLNGGNRHRLGSIPWNKGKKMPEEIKQRYYKPVMNTITGQKYSSVKECLEKEGILKKQFYKEKENGKYEFTGF